MTTATLKIKTPVGVVNASDNPAHEREMSMPEIMDMVLNRCLFVVMTGERYIVGVPAPYDLAILKVGGLVDGGVALDTISAAMRQTVLDTLDANQWTQIARWNRELIQLRKAPASGGIH